VQAERAPAYALAFTKGHAISTDDSDTIADGLSVRDASEDNVRQIQGLVDEFLLVGEEEMLAAMRVLYEKEKVTAEPAGVATTAAFLKNARKYAGQSVVLLVTGSNAPQDLLDRALRA
jgi:threonine dehydratase